MPDNLKIRVHEVKWDIPLTRYKRIIETRYDRFVADAVADISKRMGIKAADPEYDDACDDVRQYVESVIANLVGK